MEGTENNILDYKQDKHSPYEGLLYHIYISNLNVRIEKKNTPFLWYFCIAKNSPFLQWIG